MEPDPQIARVVPKGPVTRSIAGIRLVARLRWPDGRAIDVPATAIAWTEDAVEIRWEYQGKVRTDWVAVGDVRRDLDDATRPARDDPDPPHQD